MEGRSIRVTQSQQGTQSRFEFGFGNGEGRKESSICRQSGGGEEGRYVPEKSLVCDLEKARDIYYC
jgi:hypothetical protein